MEENEREREKEVEEIKTETEDRNTASHIPFLLFCLYT